MAGFFNVHRRNSSSRKSLIQSSLSRVRGAKHATDMGGVKGNQALGAYMIWTLHFIMDAHCGSSAR